MHPHVYMEGLEESQDKSGKPHQVGINNEWEIPERAIGERLIVQFCIEQSVIMTICARHGMSL